MTIEISPIFYTSINLVVYIAPSGVNSGNLHIHNRSCDMNGMDLEKVGPMCYEWYDCKGGPLSIPKHVMIYHYLNETHYRKLWTPCILVPLDQIYFISLNDLGLACQFSLKNS